MALALDMDMKFSTTARNKNAARDIEAAKRTELAMGLSGLAAPTLAEFSIRFLNSLPGRVSRRVPADVCILPPWPSGRIRRPSKL
jgi:hypothetical protein